VVLPVLEIVNRLLSEGGSNGDFRKGRMQRFKKRIAEF